ncbi:unnamed protein product [Blepharisma stoltei]|uniref:Uncharacterized protein n=1 Tax=Blepharisma stoltei TaxID=1481888 RepID=A0AAU9ILN1_9CILI|nr:unnamed protein product [Blepharisma stoltei]
MLLHKIKEGWLALNPRYKPYFLKSLSATERIALIAKQNPGPEPLSLMSRIIFKRREMIRAYEVSAFAKLSEYLKTKFWLLKLHLNKKFQDVVYLSFARSRRFFKFWWIFIGFIFGETIADAEALPGGAEWTMNFFMQPKVHWMLQYIAENTSTKGHPQYLRHDNLQQSIERIMVQGIEQEELDSLSWILLATQFASMQEDEFSYYSFHFAHLKNHQAVGAHSLQPIDTNEAARMFTK